MHCLQHIASLRLARYLALNHHTPVVYVGIHFLFQILATLTPAGRCEGNDLQQNSQRQESSSTEAVRTCRQSQTQSNQKKSEQDLAHRRVMM